MIHLSDINIDKSDYERLVEASKQVSQFEGWQFRSLLPFAVSKALTVENAWDFRAPAQVIDRIVLSRCASSRETDLSRLRRAIVAHLVLEFFEVTDRLPPSILNLFPDFLRRLGGAVGETDGAYDDDHYEKDVRYALGLTAPCGVFQVDLAYRIGPKLVLRHIAETGQWSPGWRYFGSHSWGRWYNHHLDLRAMKEFSPAGWKKSFIRMAELLELNRTVRGVAGASWFFDPTMAQVSPNLLYLQKTSLENGAYRLRMGTDWRVIQNATVRSPQRKRLYRDGEYSPVCYLLAWPRRELLSWARRQRQSERPPSTSAHAEVPAIAHGA